jgi:hypothetical protein
MAPNAAFKSFDPDPDLPQPRYRDRFGKFWGRSPHLQFRGKPLICGSLEGLVFSFNGRPAALFP